MQTYYDATNSWNDPPSYHPPIEDRNIVNSTEEVENTEEINENEDDHGTPPSDSLPISSISSQEKISIPISSSQGRIWVRISRAPSAPTTNTEPMEQVARSETTSMDRGKQRKHRGNSPHHDHRHRTFIRRKNYRNDGEVPSKPGAHQVGGGGSNGSDYDNHDEVPSSVFKPSTITESDVPIEARLVEETQDIRERRMSVVVAKIVAVETICSIPRNIFFGILALAVMAAIVIGISVGLTAPPNQRPTNSPIPQTLTLLQRHVESAVKNGAFIKSLQSSDISSNQLTGPIPSEIGALTLLTYLDLSSNQLTGPIPSAIGSLTRLTYLHLGSNRLAKTVPTEIGLLTKLSTMYMFSNSLTGRIPTEIGLLTNLEISYLWNNSLTASVPTEIGMLTRLSLLDWSFNLLSGTIPTEIGSLTMLEALAFFSGLTGTIPNVVGSLTQLSYLDLSGNSLIGTIPSDIGCLTSLTFLYLRSNELTGTIPTELGRLSNLQTLWLQNNNLWQSKDLIVCTDHINFTTLYADCTSRVTWSCCTQCY